MSTAYLVRPGCIVPWFPPASVTLFPPPTFCAWRRPTSLPPRSSPYPRFHLVAPCHSTISSSVRQGTAIVDSPSILRYYTSADVPLTGLKGFVQLRRAPVKLPAFT